MKINQFMDSAPYRVETLPTGLFFVAGVNGRNCGVFNDAGQTLTTDKEEAQELCDFGNTQKAAA